MHSRDNIPTFLHKELPNAFNIRLLHFTCPNFGTNHGRKQMLINPSRQEFYLRKYIFEIRNKRIELNVFICHTKRNGSRGFANSRDCMKEPVMQQVKGGILHHQPMSKRFEICINMKYEICINM